MFRDFFINLQNSIAEKIQTLFGQDIDVILEQPKDRSHGDYAITTALKLAKQIGRNPREIAEDISKALEDITGIMSIEIAGPGFVNICIDHVVLTHYLETTFHNELYQKPFATLSEHVIVEYPSANVAKPLAIHHLLSTVIGQCLYNVAEQLGYQVTSIDHVGDWGTQFGKMIYAYKNFNHNIKLIDATVEDLLTLYIEFGKRSQEDESLNKAARAEFLALEQGNAESQKIFDEFYRITMQDVREVLNMLGGIQIDKVMGESFYLDKMEPIIKHGIDEGIFTESEGALVCKFPDDKYTPALIRKSDGATLYLTRDLATARYRLDTWKPYRVIHVVDVAQKLHFEQLFEVGRMLGWDMSPFHHICFGRMSFKSGEKMSTRAGKLVRLREVMGEAIRRAAEVISNHQPDIDNEHRDNLARMCGLGALKYNILSQNTHTNFRFDWDDMLSLDGNSAPYLQYTYARAQSILRKGGEIDTKLHTQTLLAEEKYIIHKILQFPDKVREVFDEYKPNILANYLYEMTQDYNAMYAQHSVLQAESEEKKTLRLHITRQFAITLKQGLALLGIEVPEKM